MKLRKTIEALKKVFGLQKKQSKQEKPCYLFATNYLPTIGRQMEGVKILDDKGPKLVMWITSPVVRVEPIDYNYMLVETMDARYITALRETTESHTFFAYAINKPTVGQFMDCYKISMKNLALISWHTTNAQEVSDYFGYIIIYTQNSRYILINKYN